MSSGNTNDPGDFDRDLNLINEQYSDLEADGPPAMLDQAVLNSARRAVETRAVRPWNFGWMHTTATAALLVLGLTLVMQQRPEVPAGVDIPLAPGDASREFFDENSQLKSKEQLELNDGDSSLIDTMSADLRAEEGIEVSGQVLSESEPVSSPKPSAIFQKFEEQPRNAEIGRNDLANDRENAEKRSRASSYRVEDAPARQQLTLKQASKAANEPASDAPDIPQEEVLYETIAEQDAVTPAIAGHSFAVEEKDDQLSAQDWMAQILKMKENSDGEGWRVEFERFLAAYPDFPLPEELANELLTPPQ